MKSWEALPQIDLLIAVRRRLVLPVLDWSLKTVAPVLGSVGVRVNEDELDGFGVGLAYEIYLYNHEPLPIDRIAKYCANDVRLLAEIVGWLRDHSPEVVADDDVTRRGRARGVSPTLKRNASSIAVAPVSIASDVSRTTRFAEWLAAALNQRGWSHRELAQRIGVIPDTASAWVNGRRAPATLFLPRIAAILEVDAEIILGLV